MKMIISIITVLLTALLMLPIKVSSQSPQKATTFTIAGHAGEAQILQLNGKSYVEIETLARLTQGTLSFKANQTTLTLPPSDSERAGIRAPYEGGFLDSFHPGGHRRNERDPGMANRHRKRGKE
jgi:hypothetical protein